jgi:hypothetical protein
MIAMFLDWLCKIFALVIMHSPSFASSLKFKDAFKIGVEISSSMYLKVGIVVLE